MTFNERLKEVLTPEMYAELMQSIKLREDRIRNEYAFSNWLRGAMKSWTIWLGGLLVGLPELLPLLTPHLQEMLDADAYKRVLQLAGIAVILVRFKTTQSLSSKGAPNA